VVAPEKDFTADVDAILKRVTPKTKMVFLANPNNPTGTYCRSTRSSACTRPAAACAVRARRGLCRIRQPQRLRVRHRARRDQRERRDDAHVLEDPRLAALRLGWMYGPAHVVDAINRIRGRSTSTRRRSRPASPRSRTPRTRSARASTTPSGSPGSRRDRQARPQVTPSVGEFRADPFSARQGPHRREADAFLTKRGLILRQVGAYKLPHALRMTVGTEEANRLVVKALAEFWASQ
jgi:histidinol-phosphate aminotransferase